MKKIILFKKSDILGKYLLSVVFYVIQLSIQLSLTTTVQRVLVARREQRALWTRVNARFHLLRISVDRTCLPRDLCNINPNNAVPIKIYTLALKALHYCYM